MALTKYTPGVALAAMLCLSAFTRQALAAEVIRRDLIRQTLPCCVAVLAPGDWAPSSGWVVDAKKKWVITNKHVVRSSEKVEVMLPAYRGKKLITDRQF